MVVVELLGGCEHPAPLVEPLLGGGELVLHELADEVVVEVHLLLDRVLLDVLDVLLEQEGRHLGVAVGDGRPVLDGDRSIGSGQAEGDGGELRVYELGMAVVDVALEGLLEVRG